MGVGWGEGIFGVCVCVGGGGGGILFLLPPQLGIYEGIVLYYSLKTKPISCTKHIAAN